jgi:hypothetical protein
MGKKRTNPTSSDWFARWPVIDPPGWDDQDGLCRRHFAPISQIADPAARQSVTRLVSLDIMIAFARQLRDGGVVPLPAPLSELLRQAAPVCCAIGDDEMWIILLTAEGTARVAHHAPSELWTVPQ